VPYRGPRTIARSLEAGTQATRPGQSR